MAARSDSSEDTRPTTPASLARLSRYIKGERLVDTAAAIEVQVSQLSKMERGLEPIPSKVAERLGRHFFATSGELE